MEKVHGKLGQRTHLTICGGIMAVFCCGVFTSEVSRVPSLPFFLGGFLMGVFFGVESNAESPALEPFKSCFSGLLGSGVSLSAVMGPTIFCKLLVVGSRGLVEPCWPEPVDDVLLAFCGGVGFSRVPLGVDSPLVLFRPVPSFRLMLCVFSLS